MQNDPADPKSRQRRAHRKSRNGCLACKSRRTKCDEQGPPCVNCVIRKTECTYLSSNTTKKDVGSTVSHTPEDSPSTVSSATEYADRNLLELKLLFQWTTQTAESLEDDSDKYDWRSRVTEEAFGFEPLMDAVMAISAAHIVHGMSVTQEDRAKFINASLEYYGRCCQKFKDEVLNITKDNSIAFLSCSVALIILRMHVPEFGHDAESCVERVLAAFELLRGTWSIANMIHDESKGPLDTDLVLQIYEWRELDDCTIEALNRLQTLSQTLELYNGSNARTKSHEIYDEAVVSLKQWWMRAHLKNHGVALIWLLSVSRDFVSLVKDRDPLAQLILLHWSVLFEQGNGEKKWFSRSIGKRLVQELTVALNSVQCKDVQWLRSIAWANEMVIANPGPLEETYDNKNEPKPQFIVEHRIRH